MKLLRATIFGVLLSVQGYSIGGSYLTTPGTTVRLGSSFDPISPDKNFAIVLYQPNEVEVFAETASNTDANMAEIASETHLDEVLKIDAYAKARYGAMGGAAGYSKLRQLKFDSNTLNIAMYVRKTYAPETLTKGVGFTTFGARLLDQTTDAAGADRLLTTGGSEIVTSVTRGSFIYVVYQFSFSDSSLRNSVSAAFTASYGSMSGGVSALSQLISTNKNIQVRWAVLTEGVNGVAANASVSSLVTTSPGDVAAVRAAIASFVGATTYSSSQVVAFKTVPATDLISAYAPGKLNLFTNYDLMVIASRDKVLAITRSIEKLDEQARIAKYIDSAPSSYKNPSRTAELREKMIEIDVARRRFLARIRNADLTGDTADPTPLDFAPMRYIRFPLVSFVGYDVIPTWGPRVNGSGGDKNNQFQHLYATLTPRFLVHMPGLVEKMHFKTTDLFYRQNYTFNDRYAKYDLEIKEDFGPGYGHFASKEPIYTFGGNMATETFGMDKFRGVLLPEAGANATRSNVLEVIDVSGKTSTLTLPTLARYEDRSLIRFWSDDYGSNLSCVEQICVVKD